MLQNNFSFSPSVFYLSLPSTSWRTNGNTSFHIFILLCYFAFPAPRTQTFGRRPTPPWVHLYGRCQSLSQSFMRYITPVGATGSLFPLRGLLPCMCVNSGTFFLKVNLVETYGFTPKYPTKFPANPKSCRLHDKACYSWQK